MQKSNIPTKLFTLLIGTIVIVYLWVTSVNAQAQLTERSQLALDGIGPIRVGMTVDEAAGAAGVKLVKTTDRLNKEYCAYFRSQGEPKAINFMVTKRRIARVDINTEQMTTIRGARIDDSEDRIFSLYPGQIQQTKHHYLGYPPCNGKYLTFVPKDAADKNYRMIFETSLNRVINFRAGKLPEVEYVENCY